MCIYGRRLKNRRYGWTKKNQGNVPDCPDDRLRGIETACGICMECRKAKADSWITRLEYEMAERAGLGIFATLTFDEKELEELQEQNEDDAEKIAKIAIRRLLERYRKINKKSLRHWGVPELGHKGTQRLHIHMIFWAEDIEEKRKLKETASWDKNWQRKDTKDNLRRYWKYGNVWVGDYCDERTSRYIAKYMIKVDEDHKGFRPRIMTSAGIGVRYIRDNWERHEFRGRETETKMRRKNGTEREMPKYYKQKRWTDEEREQLRIFQLDKNEGFIAGVRYKEWNSRQVQEQLSRYREKMKEDPRNRRWPRMKYTTRFGQTIDYKERIQNSIEQQIKHYEGVFRTKNWKKRVALRKRRNTYESVLCVPGTCYAGIGVIPAFQGVNTALPRGTLRLRYEEHDGRERAEKWGNTKLDQYSNNRRGQDGALRSQPMTTQWKEKTPF